MTRQFDFGKNWVAFSRRSVTPAQFKNVCSDLGDLLGTTVLRGKTFLDIGFGQGLSLLAAAEFGAQVTGCDVSPRCSEALAITAKTLGKMPPPSIITGSILDLTTIDRLSHLAPDGYDIVHAWGVLHHTEDMTTAIANAAALVADGGQLVIAIYNRHWSSPLWHGIKRLYTIVPPLLKTAMIVMFFPVITLAKLMVTRQNPFRQNRGMSFYSDLIDWIGGYPYEYASVNKIIALCERRGFRCIRLIPATVPTGCNQFVFQKRR